MILYFNVLLPLKIAPEVDISLNGLLLTKHLHVCIYTHENKSRKNNKLF